MNHQADWFDRLSSLIDTRRHGVEEAAQYLLATVMELRFLLVVLLSQQGSPCYKDITYFLNLILSALFSVPGGWLQGVEHLHPVEHEEPRRGVGGP